MTNISQIRDGVQFIFYSTNCPNGDCRTFNLFHRVPRFKRSVSKDTTGEPDQESLDQESSAKGEENEVKENEVKEDKEVTENVVVVETEAKVEVAMNKKEKEAQENSSAEQNTDDGASNKDSASPVKSTRLENTIRLTSGLHSVQFILTKYRKYDSASSN